MQASEIISIDLNSELKARAEISSILAGHTVESDGYLVWGPYLTLTPGDWEASLEADFDNPEGCVLEVVSSTGHVRHARGTCTDAGCSLSFRLTHATDRVEIRLFCKSGIRVQLKNLTFARTVKTMPALHRPANVQRQFELHERLGLKLVLDRTSLVDRTLIQRGSWEEDRISRLTNAILEHSRAKKKKIFLDIGAYFGLYSLVMHKLQIFDEIIAFEADDYNYRQLLANMIFNDPDCQISTKYAAVSNEAGTVVFGSARSAANGNRGGSSIGGAATRGGFAVPSITVDSTVSARDAIIFAKIDVEGHEMQVLQGMEELISNNQCFLQVERFHSVEVLNEFFEKRGYRVLGAIHHDQYYTNLA